MATTTNYGWTTPDNTALVKDGAAAIRSLGSSIDTTLKAQIDAQIPDSLLTTKGDLISATAASTPARLGVGTNDQVLMADSTAATGLKWGTVAAGGMTLLSTTSLSGTSTTISSISGAYKDLQVVVSGVNWGSNKSLAVRLNSISTSSYNYTGVTATGSPSSWNYQQLNSYFGIGGTTNGGTYILHIPNYAYGTGIRSIQWFGGGTSSDAAHVTFGMLQSSIGAVSSLTFAATDFATSFTGGTVLIYGVS
jgi:hypothetical protein